MLCFCATFMGNVSRRCQSRVLSTTLEQPMTVEFGNTLFDPQPPEGSWLVNRLFCGREQTLESATKRLRKGLDIQGRRALDNKLPKKPWIIHGETRSGKSHLARRLLAVFRKRLANPRLPRQNFFCHAFPRNSSRPGGTPWTSVEILGSV